MTPTIATLGPVACLITVANAEHLTYTNALAAPFAGVAEDNLDVAANRRRIFQPLLDDARLRLAAVRTLSPASPTEDTLVSAARNDLADTIPLIRHDIRWSPADPKAPLPPDGPAALDDAVSTSSKAVQDALGQCALPAETIRRQKAYGG